MKICLHKWIYICHGHLECMPDDEKGIEVICRCEKCDKRKSIVYIENKRI